MNRQRDIAPHEAELPNTRPGGEQPDRPHDDDPLRAIRSVVHDDVTGGVDPTTLPEDHEPTVTPPRPEHRSS